MLMAEVTGVDTTAKSVITTSGAVPYDYLMLATGATHSYFGHDEWAPVAPGFKRIEDATLYPPRAADFLRAGRSGKRIPPSGGGC